MKTIRFAACAALFLLSLSAGADGAQAGADLPAGKPEASPPTPEVQAPNAQMHGLFETEEKYPDEGFSLLLSPDGKHQALRLFMDIDDMMIRAAVEKNGTLLKTDHSPENTWVVIAGAKKTPPSALAAETPPQDDPHAPPAKDAASTPPQNVAPTPAKDAGAPRTPHTKEHSWMGTLLYLAMLLFILVVLFYVIRRIKKHCVLLDKQREAIQFQKEHALRMEMLLERIAASMERGGGGRE